MLSREVSDTHAHGVKHLSTLNHDVGNGQSSGIWVQREGATGSSYLEQETRLPRSLSCILADSARVGNSKLSNASHEGAEEKEGELAGSSELIAIDRGIAPLLFSSPASPAASPPSATAAEVIQIRPPRRLGENFSEKTLPSAGRNRDSSRELLTELFPTGFASSTLSPSAVVPADPNDVTTPLAATDKETELEGRQAWTCLVLSTSSEAGVSSPAGDGAKLSGEGERLSIQGVGQQSLPVHPELPRNSTQTMGELPGHPASCAVPKIGNRPEGAPLAFESSKTAGVIRRQVDSSGVRKLQRPDGRDGVTAVGVEVREREKELRCTLDRLAPQLLQNEEKVKFLESRLQEAKNDESGRNALIKQVAKLEGEAKHLRARLEMRHAEALEWREKRRSLEAENTRLSTELHREIGRSTRLEAENRRKDALLSEARTDGDALLERNAAFETELRHKDHLLAEAEKQRKRAWQTTNASAEKAKIAVKRAEAAAREAANLRGGTHRHDVGVAPTLEAKPQSPSLVTVGGTTDGRWATNRRSTGTELNLFETAANELDRSRWKPFSPERGRSVDDGSHCVDASATFGRSIVRREGIGNDSFSRTPSHAAMAGDTLTPSAFDAGPNRNHSWRQGKVPPSDSGGGREAMAVLRPESARRYNAEEKTEITRGREQCDDVDRQRHDSHGVKRALTGANPEWADTPLESSSKVESGCDNSGHASQTERSSRDSTRNMRSNEDETAGTNHQDSEDTYVRDGGYTGGGAWSDTPRKTLSGHVAVVEAPGVVWKPFPHNNQAAGQRRGRDPMSSRRSSLSGAGAGVKSGDNERNPVGSDGAEARCVLQTDEGTHGAGASVRRLHRRATVGVLADDVLSSSVSLPNTPVSVNAARRQTLGGTSMRVGSGMRSALSLADLIGQGDSTAPEREEKGRRERASVPFATEAVEDELRPVREVERQLMLRQMEISQLEAEHTKLVPKASKTMQARVEMRNIEGRLTLLANESSELRKILREKPWDV